MKKSKVMFVPADKNNDKFFDQFEKSLRKFHSEEELPLFRHLGTGQPDFWYRAKPEIAKELIKDYEIVIGADADQIITAPLDDLWKEGDWDVKTVLNDPTYPASVWDISPYYNNGIVVLKSEEFINHWYRLCLSPHFNNYQFREQDLLNILCSDYHNYKVKCLDVEDKFYGEFAKPVWAGFHMDGDKMMLEGKQLCVIHFGGGNDPQKGNYRTRFQDDVVERIEWLIK